MVRLLHRSFTDDTVDASVTRHAQQTIPQLVRVWAVEHADMVFPKNSVKVTMPNGFQCSDVRAARPTLVKSAKAPAVKGCKQA